MSDAERDGDRWMEERFGRLRDATADLAASPGLEARVMARIAATAEEGWSWALLRAGRVALPAALLAAAVLFGVAWEEDAGANAAVATDYLGGELDL